MRRPRILCTLVLVLSALLTLTIAPSPALAATVSGTNCSAAGLANAVDAAPAGDTITFNCPDNIIEFTESDSQIDISKDVTIDGRNSGGASIILDGIADDQIDTIFFRVNGTGVHLTLQHLTLQHGSGDVSGAISNFNGTLTISHSTFANNQADFDGGAIANFGGILTITQSTFTNNQADDGGAIVNDGGTLTINQSTFSHNQAGRDGGAINNIGAIVNDGGAATISQSTFSHNQAGRDGGAIANIGAIVNDGGTLTISQSTFSHNQADRDGGAIENFDGTLKATASTFSGNLAIRAGSTVDVIAGDTTIAWSTIIQRANTTEALFISGDLTLTGVILGGVGNHCQFGVDGTLTDSYTLSNDTSCNLSGMNSHDDIIHSDGLTNLGLGPLATITLHGVPQSYYPLLPIDANNPNNPTGPDTCDTGILEDTDPEPDQLGNPRPFDDDTDNCDIGAIEFGNIPPTIQPASTSILEGTPATITILASDLDGDNLTFAIDCDTSDQTFPAFIDSNTVTCSAPDNTILTGFAQVTDGLVTNTHAFAIIVINRIPNMTTVSPNPTLVATNQSVSIDLEAIDVPADTISFTYDCDNGTGATTPFAGINTTTNTFTATASCSYTQPGTYTISATATDDDGGTSAPRSAPTTIQVVTPTPLCANTWNGQLRLTDNCTRSEQQITLPTDGLLTLCVNQWNGATRMSQRCSRSETQIPAIGDNTISTCINTWNGALRVSEHCTRSEHPDLL